MKKKFFLYSLAFAAVLAGCKDDPEPDPVEDLTLHKQVIANYADIVAANYEDALAKALVLKTRVDELVTSPSAQRLEAAKQAWLESREPYGQSEAFRFYGGPIDDDEGPEGQLNAWPLDEAYIDYVTPEVSEAANIINNVAEYPEITKDEISTWNEAGSETNVSSGYHAIEFLLWGQDLSTTGPGARPYTDYVTGSAGTGGNQARRGQYLKAVTELLVDDLTFLVNEWRAGGAYRALFTSDAETKRSIERIFNSLGKLSKGELAGERMTVALENQDQEDEHSCFSDNTHRDIVTNALGIQNVFLGKYVRLDGSTISGKGIYDLVASKNQALANEIKSLMEQSVAGAADIPNPFDQAILQPEGSPDWLKIRNVINSLNSQGDKVAQAAALFGYSVDPTV